MPRPKRKSGYRPSKPPQKENPYRQLWRIVEGAVDTALVAHPEYMRDARESRKPLRISVTKRVVGAILGYASQKK